MLANNWKPKILNLLLLITSLVGYLEWGGNQHIFLFAAEAEIIYALFTHPSSVIHPFILFPMVAQILLLFTFFQKKPSPVLTFISIAGLGLLLGFMFMIGIMSLHLKILISTLPFLTVTIITIRHYILHKKTKN
jgi:hypothetical protein